MPPTRPGAHHGDPVPQPRAGFPKSVDGGFHGAGEHGAAGGNAVGNSGELSVAVT